MKPLILLLLLIVGPRILSAQSTAKELKPAWEVSLQTYLKDPVVTEDGLVIVSGIHAIHAYQGEDGVRLWKYVEKDTFFDLVSEPDESGIIYVTTSGSIHAIESRTGSNRWVSENIPGQLRHPPIIGKSGQIYMANDRGTIFTLNKKTGRIEWQFRKNGNTIGSRLTVLDTGDAVLIWDTSNIRILTALSTADGNQLWAQGVHSSTLAPIYNPKEKVLIVCGFGVVEALHPNTGERVWESKLNNETPVSVATGEDGLVHIACSQGKLFTLDAKTGQRIWEIQGEHAAKQHGSLFDGECLIIKDERVYFVMKNKVVGYDRQTGMERWSWESKSSIHSGLLVSDVLLTFRSYRNHRVVELTNDQTWEYVSDKDFYGHAIHQDTAFLKSSNHLYAFKPNRKENHQPTNTSLFTSPANFTIQENTKDALFQIHARGAEEYLLLGPDVKFFTLDNKTGELGLTKSLNFEGRNDDNADNIYTVVIEASNDEFRERQTVHIKLTNDPIDDENSSPGDIRWVFEAGDAIHSSPAITANETVYFGSDDTRVYALRKDGTLLWDFLTQGAVKSSPAVGKDGIVYVGSDDHHVYALDGETGKMLWSFETNGPVRASPLPADNGLLYVASMDSWVYALDTLDGIEIWRNTALTGIESSPILYNGYIFVYADEIRRIYSFDSGTGKLNWKFQAPGRIPQGISLRPGGLLSATGYWFSDIEHITTIFLDAKDGTNLSPNSRSRRASSKKKTESSPDSNSPENWFNKHDQLRIHNEILKLGYHLGPLPAIGPDGKVYSVSGDDNRWSLRKTKRSHDYLFTWSAEDGNILWKRRVDGKVGTIPALGPEGTVYLGTGKGKLYAIQGYEGYRQEAWPMERQNPMRSAHVPPVDAIAPEVEGPSSFAIPENKGDATFPVSIRDGDSQHVSVHLMGADGSLFDWDDKAQVLKFRELPDYDFPGDADENNEYVVVLLATDGYHSALKTVRILVTENTTKPKPVGPGQLLWSTKVPEKGEYIGLSLGPDGEICVSNDGEIHGYDSKIGNLLVKEEKPRGYYELPGYRTRYRSVNTHLPEIGMTLLFNQKLSVVREVDGHVMWEYETHVRPQMVYDRLGVIYGSTSESEVVAIDIRDGREIWSKPHQKGKVRLVQNDSHIYGAIGDWIVALDKVDGKMGWAKQYNGSKYKTLVSNEVGELIVAGKQTLLCINAQNGDKVWESKVSVDTEVPPTVGPDGVIYASSEEGTVYAFNGENGSLLWRFQTGKTISHEMILTEDGILGVLSEDGELFAIKGYLGLKTYTEMIQGLGEDSSPNTPPVFTSPTSYTIQENSGINEFQVSAADTDPGTKLVYSLSGKDHDTFRIDSGSGVLSFIEPPQSDDPATGVKNTNHMVSVFVQDVETIVHHPMNISVENDRTDDKPFELIWRFSPEEKGRFDSVKVIGQIENHIFVIFTGQMYVGLRSKLFALDIATGQEQWNWLKCQGALLGDGVIYTYNREGIHALDSATGSNLWSKLLRGMILDRVFIDENKLYGISYHGDLVCLSVEEGEILWQKKDVGKQFSKDMLTASGKIPVFKDHKWMVLDADSGMVKWESKEIPSKAYTHNNHLLLISANDVIQLFDIHTGDLIWETRIAQSTKYTRKVTWFDNDVVCIKSFEGNLVGLDLKTGKQLWQKDIGKHVRVFSHENWLLFTSEDRFRGNPGGHHPENLSAINSLNGEIAWEIPINGKLEPEPQFGNDGLMYLRSRFKSERYGGAFVGSVGVVDITKLQLVQHVDDSLLPGYYLKNLYGPHFLDSGGRLYTTTNSHDPSVTVIQGYAGKDVEDPKDPIEDTFFVLEDTNPKLRVSHPGMIQASVSGEDVKHFNFEPETGKLQFKFPPDYETPVDTDGDNRYRIGVTTENSKVRTTRFVTINIANNPNDD